MQHTNSYSSVIFDMDGTLVRLDIPWKEVTVEALVIAERLNIRVDPILHLSILCDSLSRSSHAKNECDALFLRWESKCLDKGNFLAYQEIVDIIHELAARGTRLGIASSNHTQTVQRVVHELGLDRVFQFISGRDTVAQNKPDPEQLRLAMHQISASPNNTLFVGDSDNDREAARAVSIDFFLVGDHIPAETISLRKHLHLS